MKWFRQIPIGFALIGGLTVSLMAQDQWEPENPSLKILSLMEEMLEKVQPAILQIDPELKRIALYRISTDSRLITPPLRDHFENRLIETLKSLEQPALVALPEFNTLKITSTDTSFSIINSLPSPDELWRIGRRLRIDGFLEGKLSYLPGNALILDLRLNRVGTNEVLWAQSITVFEKPMKRLDRNPYRLTVNLGAEILPLAIQNGNTGRVRPDFNGRMMHYNFSLGFYQNLWNSKRYRYEFRVGASFISEGFLKRNTFFESQAFYGTSNSAPISFPVSYHVRTLVYSTLIENKKNEHGDWLSLYFAVMRYFALKMPDFTALGLGFRSDISSNFSLSVGMLIIPGNRFETVPLKETNESFELQIKGIGYELLFLQYRW